MNVRPSVRWAALVVVAAALPLMSACSESGSAASSGAVTQASTQLASPSSQSSPSSQRTAAEITAACPLVETSEVDEAFSVSGATGTEAPPQKLANGGQAYVCAYTAGGDEAAALVASVFEGNKVTPDQMIKAMMDKNAGSERVSGIGEGAVYYADQKNGTSTFSAVKVVSGTPVMVAVSGPATADKNRVGVLVKHAVDKL
jgi:hypothetical protein